MSDPTSRPTPIPTSRPDDVIVPTASHESRNLCGLGQAYASGNRDGYEQGFAEGYRKGFQEGHRTGYDEGYDAWQEEQRP